ncbi:MAG: 50S ribosomal protein L18 [Dehalococcoidia bacterium]|jgi:large subunit ribosomal protein L18|nr:50S ribosomal protein L18 [Dehalococcoidia bacterium]
MARKNPILMRKVRHERVRRKVHGTVECPRLAVYRSLQHIYAQVIDDERHHTIAAASTVEHGVADAEGDASKTEMAGRIGALVAQRAIEQGVKRVVFDRGGFKYHGRVRALADEARKAGLDF